MFACRIVVDGLNYLEPQAAAIRFFSFHADEDANFLDITGVKIVNIVKAAFPLVVFFSLFHVRMGIGVIAKRFSDSLRCASEEINNLL